MQEQTCAGLVASKRLAQKALDLAKALRKGQLGAELLAQLGAFCLGVWCVKNWYPGVSLRFPLKPR